MDLSEVWPRGATPHPRSEAAVERSYHTAEVWAVAERSNPMSKERRLRGCRRAKRSYSTFKVGGVAALCWSSHEEIPHVQGKRNPSKMIGVARGHQRAETLKP